MPRWRSKNRFRWLVEGSYENRLDLGPEEVDCMAVVGFENFLGTEYPVAACSHPACCLASTTSGSTSAQTPNYSNSHPV